MKSLTNILRADLRDAETDNKMLTVDELLNTEYNIIFEMSAELYLNQFKRGWISVEMSVPEKFKGLQQSANVLVYGYFGIRIGRYNYYESQFNNWDILGLSHYTQGVTHWMPLPEPPSL